MQTTRIFLAATFTVTLFSAAIAASAATPPAQPRVIHVQRMPEGKITHKVMPQYPLDAVDHHIYGLVKVNVMIGKDGRVERIKLIGGHPLLAPAALQAVRQWTFQPTQANGIPVHVVTEIDLPFDLDAHGLPIAPKSQSRPGSSN